MAPPRPPPELMEDLVAEILLRLPPEHPACLVRASLVCKPWRRLVADREFLRCYRAFHRAPPLLGFLHNRVSLDSFQFPRFVPTTTISSLPQPATDQTNAWALDSRHGRVLLLTWRSGLKLVVWDPITGDLLGLPSISTQNFVWSGVVLCAMDGCDHLCCHGGPFRVVFVTSGGMGEVTSAYLYSSETDAWSMPTSLDTSRYHCIKLMERGTVIGDEIYFTMYNKILKYDLGNHCLCVMDDNMPHKSWHNVLMPMEDGSLGLAGMRDSSLYLWSRKLDPQGVGRWEQYGVIKLSKVIHITKKPCQRAGVIGFAEGVNIILVTNGVCTFEVQIKSGQVRKVDDHGDYNTAFPYICFHTPDLMPGRTC